MKAAITLLLAAVVNGHYTFPKLAGTSDWQVVRRTANFQSNGPVTDVGSTQIRCFQQSAGGGGSTQTFKAQAGQTLTWSAAPNIFHPGPLSAYMAKVPEGQTLSSWDGSGAVWFKTYQEMPSGGGSQMNFGSLNKGTVDFKIPQCIPSGDYLFRIEHVALHSTGAPQFYISCAQVSVSGGGSKVPTNLVSFPGAYKASDPGFTVNIYNSRGQYQPAGPAVFSC